jgi:hypothetical protein
VIATAGGWWFASRGAAGLGILAIVVAATPVMLLVRLRPARVPFRGGRRKVRSRSGSDHATKVVSSVSPNSWQ